MCPSFKEFKDSRISIYRGVMPQTVFFSTQFYRKLIPKLFGKSQFYAQKGNLQLIARNLEWVHYASWAAG